VSSERRLTIFGFDFDISSETGSEGNAELLFRRAASLADSEGRRGIASGEFSESGEPASFSLTTFWVSCKDGGRSFSLEEDVRRSGVADEMGGAATVSRTFSDSGRGGGGRGVIEEPFIFIATGASVTGDASEALIGAGLAGAGNSADTDANAAIMETAGGGVPPASGTVGEVVAAEAGVPTELAGDCFRERRCRKEPRRPLIGFLSGEPLPL